MIDGEEQKYQTDFLDETSHSNDEIIFDNEKINQPEKSVLENPNCSTYLIVQVIDTGVGISEEDQKHLFKLFGKLKTTFHINQ